MPVRRTLAPALALALALTALLAAPPPAAAQPDPDQVTIEVTDLGSGVHMLTGAGGNIGVSAGADGVFLIDDQYAPLTPKIRAAVEKLGKPIRFVLNTHFHGDHTGGNENLGEAGVLIVAHDNVRTRLATEQFNSFFDRTVPPSPEGALPVVTFNDTVTFHLNGEEIHAFHVPPAHTDGDSVVHFRGADVVHLGDLFFNGNFPFVDVDGGGDFFGLVDAVGHALQLVGPDTKIIPGHGPLASREDLKAYHGMLTTVGDRLKPRIEAGEPFERLIESKPLEDLSEEWGQGFIGADALVTFVYNSLVETE